MREFMGTTQRTNNIGALDFVGKKKGRRGEITLDHHWLVGVGL